MILKGSQRGGAKALAQHLLNEADNDHVVVHSVQGFMVNDVEGALLEIEAISRATRCKQYMFSVSLSPPPGTVVANQDFVDAARQSMERLGLADQPHVIIFHEKHGRRHAHLVVSRIDTDAMKAVNLSFFKEQLCGLSRELYLTHGWDLPKGHEDRKLSDPLNYGLEESQVAKRANRDPQALKDKLQACWVQSDSKSSFEAALSQQGFALARGDRRGFVAVDAQGNIYSLSRWLGVKTKDLRGRLGDPAKLRVVEEILAEPSQAPVETSMDQVQEHARLERCLAGLNAQKAASIATHRSVRNDLRKAQQTERVALINSFKKTQRSMGGMLDWLAGKRPQIIAAHKAELSELRAHHDLAQLTLSIKQSAGIRALRYRMKSLERKLEALSGQVSRTQAFDPLLPQDKEALFTAAQIRRTPERVLDVLIDTKAEFSKDDIRRALARYIPNPTDQKTALDSVLRSNRLLEISPGRYTTKAFHKVENAMLARAKSMSSTKAYGVSPGNLKSAIRKQNKALQNAVGANLSAEQRHAIAHLVNRRQLSAVIGFAGSGKSTMLAAARDAWERQGYHVIGGALAGKAELRP